jgi:hypothetical protein
MCFDAFVCQDFCTGNGTLDYVATVPSNCLPLGQLVANYLNRPDVQQVNLIVLNAAQTDVSWNFRGCLVLSFLSVFVVLFCVLFLAF